MNHRQRFVAALTLALLAGMRADASAAVDQSQLSSNFTAALQGGPNGPTGQSFTAGVTGRLSEVDLYTRGNIANGSNNVNWEVRAGNGAGGTILGSSSSTFPPLTFDFANDVATLAFDTGGLNINLTAGSTYTFLITSVGGSGDLPTRGVLAQHGTNPYAGGRAYEGAYPGDFPNNDLGFRTHVVPEPASGTLLGAGAFVLLGLRRRATNDKGTSRTSFT
jgi:hypothetical protein